MATDGSSPVSRFWLCPLYSFKCDAETVTLTKGVEITRISPGFVEYLEKHYSHRSKTMPSAAKWMASLPGHTDITGITEPLELSRIGFQELDRADNLLVDLMTALRLYQKGRVVAGLLTSAQLHNSEWSYGGTTSWTSVSSIDFFEEEPMYELRRPNVPKINELLQNIRQWRAADVLKTVDTALRRFHSAYHGPIEDRVIDQMIAFESLYIADEKELGYKLALRTAFLLGRKRKQIFTDMRNAYGFRGKIVHGGKQPNRDVLRHITPKTEEYLRQSIRKFLLLLSQGNSLKIIRDKLDENILKNGRTLTNRG
ncbi:MAG: HEPN domain-containing protein [Chloroflexota bacterium]|nr:HEPN domain-containing protein [Chloroflexota bacterium]